ncbi:hypothetical protein [Rickettsia sp.]|uniref:hypothetical protein n=1 Tax=Rickettsia sp. TaxID=789 RepID=UPI003979357C
MLLRFLAHILILNLSFERSLLLRRYLNCHCEEALLRRPVKSTVSPRGLTTGSIKTIDFFRN